MGAGASSANSGSSKRSDSKAEVTMNKKAKAKNDGDFNIICRVVFDEADRNKNGKLDNGEVRNHSSRFISLRLVSFRPRPRAPHLTWRHISTRWLGRSLPRAWCARHGCNARGRRLYLCVEEHWSQVESLLFYMKLNHIIFAHFCKKQHASKTHRYASLANSSSHSYVRCEWCSYTKAPPAHDACVQGEREQSISSVFCLFFPALVVDCLAFSFFFSKFQK